MDEAESSRVFSYLPYSKLMSTRNKSNRTSSGSGYATGVRVVCNRNTIHQIRYRVHILQRINRYGDILAGNFTTELLNEVYLRRKPKTEKLHQFKQKANGQFRSQISSLTTIDQPKLRGTRTYSVAHDL